MLRFFKRLLWLGVLAVVVLLGFYLTTSAFSQRWRLFVIQQLDVRGVYVDFDRLTIDPFRGLVARNVHVFNDQARHQLVAKVERVNLDFDFGKLLRGEFNVEALDLAETYVSLPVDPEHPELIVVDIKDLTARIFLMDDRLDIKKAEGVLEGIHLSVTGSLNLPQSQEDPEKRKKDSEQNAAKRLKFIRDNRQQIQAGIQWLGRFQFAKKPRVEVAVQGSLEKLQELEARMSVSVQGLGYGTYLCERVELQAQYNAGFFDLTRLHMKDRLGTVDASGGWQMGGDEVRFQLSTSADLQGLAAAFFDQEALKELVLYESPNLSMDGIWYVKGAKSKGARPLNVLGKLQCGRFNSRGEIFDGLAVNFGVDPVGLYLRDGLLKHKTGTLSFQTMYHVEQGLRYRATVRMDPAAFLPFVSRDMTRELIKRFKFKETSSIYARIEGGGPELKPDVMRTLARVEARDFSYRGVAFDEAEGDIELAGPINFYRNMTARRGGGIGMADEVYVNHRERWVRLKGVSGTLEPVAVTSCFVPNVADYISRYRLSGDTEVSVSGTVGWADERHNDLKVTFRDAKGTGIYSLWGEDYAIQGPQGEVGYKKRDLSFDIKGGLFGRPMTALGKVNLRPGATDYTVSVKAGSLPYEVVGERLPFSDVVVGVAAEKQTVAFDVGAKIFGGGVTLRGDVGTVKEPYPFKGEIRLNGASFRQFAQTYSPGFDTEGDLTGHFNFSGVLNDWKKLKGEGAAIIVNGNLYAIPIIGPLTPLLGALFPAPIKGYNVAKEANCTYRVGEGFILTDNLEAFTSAFKIVSNGKVDFIGNEIRFGAQVRVRGLPGIVLRPVSELLEYKATGTVGNPVWKLNPFGLGGNSGKILPRFKAEKP
jgi:hypothetical protein